MEQMKWPNNKKFAFTIIDDTDYSFVDNIEPIYSLLDGCGIKTTKTTWVYPPRDHFKGHCLEDEHYQNFIRKLQSTGVEIAFHGAGSGEFTREEIIEGIEDFKRIVGYYPKIHINHGWNPDNIYWGDKRFIFPLSNIVRLFYGKDKKFFGDKIGEQCFWGDICKDKIKYIRNHVFSDINTEKCDRQMPYRSRKKDTFSNYWFSSSDGDTVKEANRILSKENIDQLEEVEGFCILYTHFGCDFVDSNGQVNKTFESNIRYLSQKEGWFVPAGMLLDYLLENKTTREYASYTHLARLDIKWVIDKIKTKWRKD